MKAATGTDVAAKRVKVKKEMKEIMGQTKDVTDEELDEALDLAAVDVVDDIDACLVPANCRAEVDAKVEAVTGCKPKAVKAKKNTLAKIAAGKVGRDTKDAGEMDAVDADMKVEIVGEPTKDPLDSKCKTMFKASKKDGKTAATDDELKGVLPDKYTTLVKASGRRLGGETIDVSADQSTEITTESADKKAADDKAAADKAAADKKAADDKAAADKKAADDKAAADKKQQTIKKQMTRLPRQLQPRLGLPGLPCCLRRWLWLRSLLLLSLCSCKQEEEDDRRYKIIAYDSYIKLSLSYSCNHFGTLYQYDHSYICIQNNNCVVLCTVQT